VYLCTEHKQNLTMKLLHYRLNLCYKAIVVTLLSLFSLQSIVFAQSCRLFTTRDALPNTLVNDIVEDADNMIWVATEYGLCRYDGSKFTTYQVDEGNPHTLASNYVRALYVDSKGRLMVGTRQGLQIYRPQTDDFSELAVFADGRVSGDVTMIIERKNGEIWMSGNTPCCARIREDGTPELYANALTDKVDYTENILEDNQGRIWTNRRLSELIRLDTDGEIVRLTQDGKSVPFNIMYIGLDGELYAGGNQLGLYRFNLSNERFELMPSAMEGNFLVRAIMNLDRDHLLVATDNHGLQIFDCRAKTFSSYLFDDGRIDAKTQKVHSICIDHNHVMWLALFQRGVMMVPQKPQPFQYLGSRSSSRNTVGDKCITSLFQDSKREIWVTSDNGGVYAIDEKGTRLRHFPYSGKPNTIPCAIVRMYEDSKHRYWYGSYAEGYGWIDPNTGAITQLTIDGKDASTANVYDFTEDNNGRIWAITMGAGLHVFDEKRQTMVRPFEYDSCRWANCFYFDPLRDKLFIGSYNGLTMVDLKDNSFAIKQYLGNSIVFSITPYTSGRLALCTTEGFEILDLNTEQSTKYDVNDGLQSNLLYATECDATGMLWISTNVGLSCFNEKRRQFTNFSAHDGLQSAEFYKNASMKDLSGRIWFGGTAGITFFNPQEVNLSGEKCLVRIVDVTAGGQVVRNRVKRNFEDNSFSFEMATLPLHHTRHAVYSYSLDNDPWTVLKQGQNVVSFSHLASGKHIFRYKAQVSGIESEGNSYEFSIAYPWYRSWWVNLVILTLLAVIAYLIFIQIQHRRAVRKRLERHVHNQAINEAKLQFFMNIAHEIRTPMTMIVSPLQKLISTDSDPDRQHAYRMIQRNADRITGTINQLMDLRKIDKKQMKIYCSEVKIASYIKEICNSMQDVADVRQIQLSLVDNTPEGLRLWVDNSNFDKILLNLLSNAMKYTPAGGKVVVELRQDAPTDACPEGIFRMMVTDTGEGIPDSDKNRVFDRFYQVRSTSSGKGGTGIGLHLTESLVELHHGTIEVQDNPDGHGTRFVVSLPLGRSHFKNNEISSEPLAEPNVSRSDIYQTNPDSYVAELDPAAETPRSRSLIIVAEDDDEIRRYIVHELSAYCRVVECCNGKEAFDNMLHQVPDLLLTDVMMPEMDGFELCRKVRGNVRMNHIPVVFLTAKSDEENRLDSLDLGVDAFLTKPFNMEVLRRTVLNLLKSRASLRNTFSGQQMPVDQVEMPESKTPDERLMERIMRVVNQNLSNPELTSEMIAEEVGMSRVHLYRKLKELTNQSARNFIRNIRLAKAAELMAQKKCSIAEVSDAVGFANPSNFATAFKEMYGMTPTAYMDEHLAENRENE